MLDKALFGWFAFNMALLFLSLGIWGAASITMVFVHPSNPIAWILFLNIITFLYYMRKEI